jgi:hypothetical protein
MGAGASSSLTTGRHEIREFIVALWCTPEYHAAALQFVGAAEDDLYRQWLPLLSYALDCADEARLLMHKLDLA